MGGGGRMPAGHPITHASGPRLPRSPARRAAMRRAPLCGDGVRWRKGGGGRNGGGRGGERRSAGGRVIATRGVWGGGRSAVGPGDPPAGDDSRTGRRQTVVPARDRILVFRAQNLNHKTNYFRRIADPFRNRDVFRSWRHPALWAGRRRMSAGSRSPDTGHRVRDVRPHACGKRHPLPQAAPPCPYPKTPESGTKPTATEHI